MSDLFREQILNKPASGEWDADTLAVLGIPEYGDVKVKAITALDVAMYDKEQKQESDTANFLLVGQSVIDKEGKRIGKDAAVRLPIINIKHIVKEIVRINGLADEDEELTPKTEQT